MPNPPYSQNSSGVALCQPKPVEERSGSFAHLAAPAPRDVQLQGPRARRSEPETTVALPEALYLKSAAEPHGLCRESLSSCPNAHNYTDRGVGDPSILPYRVSARMTAPWPCPGCEPRRTGAGSCKSP